MMRLKIICVAGVVLCLAACQGPAGPSAAPHQFDGRYTGSSVIANQGGGGRCFTRSDKVAFVVRDNLFTLGFNQGRETLLIDANGQFYGHVSEGEVNGKIAGGVMTFTNATPYCTITYTLTKG